MFVVGYLKRAIINLLPHIHTKEIPLQAQQSQREVIYVEETGGRRVDQI